MTSPEYTEERDLLQEESSSYVNSEAPPFPEAAFLPEPDTGQEFGGLLENTPSGIPHDGPAGQPETALKVLGIRFQRSGQVHFFSAPEQPVRIGTKVIVQLEQGPALGEVASILAEGLEKLLKEESQPGKVIGPATAQDIASHTENRILAAEASAFCKTCIRQRELDMKLVDVEVLHDRSKIIFYFTAPSRIDFRDLVKDLVRNYRTRIELRQIGVRHETQMIGGIGNCGTVCCCHRFLRKFAPVTIKMAKEQNLFLNPSKLSGMCGRLLCCLSFEQNNYDEFNRRSPKIGKKYGTSLGSLRILRTNMFSQSIFCLSPTNEELEFTLEEWEKLQPRRSEHSGDSRPPDDLNDESQTGEAWENGEAFPASMEDDGFSAPLPGAAERPNRPQNPHQGAGRGRKKRRPG